MHLKFRGALTFDEDDALENGLMVIEKKVQETENSFLTMEHLQPLGLHVTVNHHGTATQAQMNSSRDILITLAKLAYSGYVDMIVDEVQKERLHAKELAPKVPSINDIIVP
jgi:hypothetical protein